MKKIIYSSGEPAGIGPDLIIKLAFSKEWENFRIPILVVGDPCLFLDRSRLLKKNLKIINIDSIKKLKKNKKGILQVITVNKCKNTSPGKIFKSNAKYVLNNLNYAIKETLSDKSAALVTGPLSKESIISVKKDFSGHTEHIQKLTKSNNVLMMLASKKLNVALATTHIPIKDVANKITKKLIIDKIKILNEGLKSKFNIKNPNIKVLGLNPHSGENGKIGDEEVKIIKPAIKELKKENINISFPISADTAFSIKNLKETDAYLGMYHDQVLPVLKALSFGESVNITLGVPIIRTSVDHGIALDIAGTGYGDTSSLSLAIKIAKKLL
ncbi:MAG: 4-hydroxythreonine-4-phosphate dehydrogenase PdxA [Gammaproteobacteria bacterium]|nr:4-hydroxythreonine-4-phosphate dehydrogenase PdxA [Gammaproteobacteria bacterium]